MVDLGIHRRSQIDLFCVHNLALKSWGFVNVTQAGKYALKVLSIAGDGAPERKAILAHIWAYHRRIVTGEIPFTFLFGVILCTITGCTPY